MTSCLSYICDIQFLECNSGMVISLDCFSTPLIMGIEGILHYQPQEHQLDLIEAMEQG